MRWWLIACTALSLAAQPKWQNREELEQFLFPAGEDDLQQTMQALFVMDRAGSMVTVAAQAGPAYLAKAAGVVRDDAFRDSYTQLGQYVDRAGGCFRKSFEGKTGWWSNYPDVGEHACSELIKLIAGRLLWNQVHYCREILLTRAPDGRLDAAPVQSPFFRAESAYAVAAALIRFGLSERIPANRLRAELERASPRSELIAIEAGKAVLEHWESMHQEHLDRKSQSPASQPGRLQ